MFTGDWEGLVHAGLREGLGHDLPALSALWPSLQERGRFGNTEAPRGRTLLLSGRSCLVTMPGRTQDKVLPQVCTWGLREPQSELQQLQGQARCLGSFLGARILDSDVTASSGGRGGGWRPFWTFAYRKP